MAKPSGQWTEAHVRRLFWRAGYGDFDTHGNQAGDLGDGLSKVSSALAAFQADIEARGLGDRVLTLVWSEFGRACEAAC